MKNTYSSGQAADQRGFGIGSNRPYSDATRDDRSIDPGGVAQHPPSNDMTQTSDNHNEHCVGNQRWSIKHCGRDCPRLPKVNDQPGHNRQTKLRPSSVSKGHRDRGRTHQRGGGMIGVKRPFGNH